ncbi:hypothetical protein SLA2020_154330 [Shorea laevis]
MVRAGNNYHTASLREGNWLIGCSCSSNVQCQPQSRRSYCSAILLGKFFHLSSDCGIKHLGTAREKTRDIL